MNNAKNRISRSLITFLAAVVMLLSMPSLGFAFFQNEEADSLLYIEEGLNLRREMRFDPDYQLLMKRLINNPAETGALNSLGGILIEYDNLDSAEAVFKSSLKINDTQAAAHDGLGLVYLKKGTNYLSLLGAFRRITNSDNYSKSIREFEKALSIDSGFHEATLHIAEAHMKKADAAKSKGSNFENALKVLEELIEIEPYFPETHFLLGKAHYELGNYEEAKENLIKELRLNKNHNPAKIYIGLAYYNAGQLEDATKNYLEGLDTLDDRDLLDDIFQDFKWVLTEKERDEYNALPFELRGNFISGFWRKNDPNVITRDNERMLEHFRRVTYAKTIFDAKNYRGYDDRGEIYIKYGEPKYRNFASTNSELWQYVRIDQYLTYEFTSNRGVMPYRIAYSNSELRGIAIANAPTHNFILEFEEEPLDFPWSYAQFKGDNGKTDIEIYIGVPLENLQFNDIEESPSVYVESSIIALDSNFTGIDEVATSQLARSLEDNKDQYVLNMEVLELRPGDYIFGIQLIQENTPLLGIYQPEIAIRDYNADSLMISDIRIATGTRQADFTGSDSREKLKMKPYPFSYLYKSQQLVMYFEVYNLHLDQTNTTRYDIEYSIEKDNSNSGSVTGLFKKIGGLFGGDNVERISVREERRGNMSTVHELIALDISSLSEMNTNITITVEDKISGEKSTSTRKVRIRK